MQNTYPPDSALDEVLQATSEQLRRHPAGDDALGAMLYLGNLQESIPSLLIRDPVLDPSAKIVWQIIRVLITEAGQHQAFMPGVQQIADEARLSRPTVVRCLAALRVTCWLTRRSIQDSQDPQARFNSALYLLNDEPLPLPETVRLDPEYMAFLMDAREHGSPGIRAAARMIWDSIQEDLDQGEDVLAPPDRLNRRMEALQHVRGHQDKAFFGIHPGQIRCGFHRVKNLNPVETLRGGSCSSSYINTTTTTTTTPTEGFSENGPGSDGSPITPGDSPGGVVGSNRQGMDSVGAPADSQSPGEAGAANEILRKLIWPAALNQNLRILACMQLRHAPDSSRQSILDELDGRLQAASQGASPVYDPIRWLRKLCEKCRNGEFTPNLGIKVRERREQAARQQRARQLAAQRAAAELKTIPDNELSPQARRVRAMQQKASERKGET